MSATNRQRTVHAVKSRITVSGCLLGILLGLWPVSSPVMGQEAVPIITKAEVKCIAGVPYPIISASIRAADEVQIAKVYFRAAQGEDFYFVEMASQERGYKAILPVPSDETNRVIYYVEAVSASFEAGRTEEYEAPVRDDCDEDRFLGDDPGIVIYAVAEGAPIPTGFLSTGVSTTVSATGVATAVTGGGGLGAGAITGIILGGGLVGWAIADELDDETPKPISPGG